MVFWPRHALGSHLCQLFQPDVPALTRVQHLKALRGHGYTLTTMHARTHAGTHARRHARTNLHEDGLHIEGVDLVHDVAASGGSYTACSASAAAGE